MKASSARGLSAIVVSIASAMLSMDAYAWGGGRVPVAVHGVNYSNEEFSYIVVDPSDSNNAAGGETVDRFSAGGTLCCYELPARWRPDLTVKVELTWRPRGDVPKAEKSLSDVVIANVPAYDGAPGELWVIRKQDGSIAVISSNFQPNHEKWPGQIKGWPTPSADYIRERREVYFRIAQQDLVGARANQRRMNKDMGTYAEGMWQLLRKHRPREVKEFSGANDPRFREFLKNENSANIDYLERRVNELKSAN